MYRGGMTTAADGIGVPDWAWHSEVARAALRARDVGALFRFAQAHTGLSQGGLAGATNTPSATSLSYYQTHLRTDFTNAPPTTWSTG